MAVKQEMTHCRRCGACCRIKDGIVRVSEAEVRRIAAFLGMSEEDFIANETEVAPDRKSLMLKSNPDGACVYLTPDNLCRINPVKPDKCRTFPAEWTNPDSTEVCPELVRRGVADASGKDKIRNEMRTRRRAVSDRKKADAAAAICAKLLSRTDAGGLYEGNATIAVYLASPDEIDLGSYIKQMLERSVRLVAPRWNGEAYELAELDGLDARHLRRGPMGIMEPADGKMVAPQEVLMWIVPGLAFTCDGRRLGYGGGWYDRFLAVASKDSVKIGVAYSFQIVENLPIEPYDIPLTAVIDDSNSSIFNSIN